MTAATGLLLGIDVGTSGVKVVLSDRDGALVRDGARRYPTSVDARGGAEQDPGAWWTALTELTRSLIGPEPIAGVAVTSQAPTLVPLDAEGEPAGPALTWLDRRAEAEAQEIAAVAPGHRHGADPFFGTAKLLWLRRERPEVLARTRTVVSANGFVVRRLTGRAALDDSTAALLQAFDETTGALDARLAEAGVPAELLGEIVPTTAVVGAVTAAAEAATGIPAGTPVLAGAIDSVGSALEAGALAVGDPLVEMNGFSSVTILPVPAGVHVPGFIHTRHCLPGVDLLITAQVTAGATVDWVNGLAGGPQDLREAGPLLARRRPSPLMVVPALAGERTPSWNPRTRGMIDGIGLDTDGVDLMLAAMEGNALALAADLEQLAAHGFPVPEMRATGGGSASDVWMQIKADVLGIPVSRPRTGHGAAHGAAFLAGIGLGLLEPAQLRERTAEITRTFTPDAALTQDYARRRRRFARLLELARDREDASA
ncbi:xylulokinase [Brachybacterium phenoliresistens]|uniref:xylulokinase n=1 Tax=Brachybacterium phenoliresistens TaxID=396014 RepID=UPI0031D56D1A